MFLTFVSSVARDISYMFFTWPVAQSRAAEPAPPLTGGDAPCSGDLHTQTSMLDAVAGQLPAPSEMTDECGWQRWTSQVGDPVGLVRHLWPSIESRVGPKRSLVAGRMRRPVPVPHVQLTRGGASRGGPVVGELLRDAHSASSLCACGPNGARPSAGSCAPAGRRWLRCWVSCRPKKERMVGLLLSRASKAPRSWRLWCRAVRSRRSPCCYSERSPRRGCDARCTAATRRNDVSKCAGAAEVVLVTPVSLE
ncbi:hypothetical protein SRABI02_01259 [Plantibacter cousiniae]|nr:hypothetical protein SRABI02_01259 [Plantibacter cousiniae]